MTDPAAPSALAAVEAAISARGVEWSFDPSTARIADLMDLLGSPQRGYPVIHITGTNGKSSVTRMIEALLRARGLRTGRFTSPHLHSMRERVAVDGVPLDPERFVAAYAEIEPYIGLVDARHPVRMSFFEVLTGMAFAAFADAPVDVAAVEVGMGGSWDATNVADGQVAVVTPIALDHLRHLGGTLEEIATEKAGIIKPDSVAVLAHQPAAAAEILLRRSVEVGARVAREGLEFGVIDRDVAVGGQRLRLRGLHEVYDEVFLPLYGAHQATNAACALAAVEALAGDEPLAPDLVASAFAGVTSPARLEVVRRSPTIIVDVAHNPAGMAASVDALTESFAFTRLVGVMAVMADKDVFGMLEPLEPVLTELVVTTNSSPRALDPAELAELAGEVLGAERVHRAARLDDAIDLAVRLAEQTGELSGAGVLVTGSVVTADDARTLLGVGDGG